MNPRAVYDERLARHREALARLQARERLISITRLVAIALAIILALLAFAANRIDGIWVLLPVAAFIVLVIGHEQVIARPRRLAAAARVCEDGLARLTNAWAGNGIGGSEFADEHHPFAGDLDLFGSGSLYELLCVAATASGGRTLAAWLLHPGDAKPAEVRERQEAVAELRDDVRLREEIAVHVAEV